MMSGKTVNEHKCLLMQGHLNLYLIWISKKEKTHKLGLSVRGCFGLLIDKNFF